MYIVYQHVNTINSKVYIGITKHITPNKRWRNGKGYRKDSLFYKAILKYGWDNFQHNLIAQNLTKQVAIQLEIKLISYYKELQLSYNIGNGGEGTLSFSKDTIDKLKQYRGIKASMYGKHHTQQTKDSISKYNLGRKMSKETHLKISNANKGIKNGMYGKNVSLSVKKQVSERFSKPVLQYTVNSEFVTEYSSATEAQKILKIKTNHIGSCCKGLRKTCGGYIWKYKENYDK